MRFLIITHVLHKYTENLLFAYGPYVKEMNLWLKYADEVIIVAPIDNKNRISRIDIPYNNDKITFLKIPQFNVLNFKDVIRTIYLVPIVVIQIVRGMISADHIHLRCPGNVGLIGCILQIFFPFKKKTAKYASNWDWKIHQPWSYRVQQFILRNTFITRNMTTLIYGDWPDKTRNIKSLFTASYSERDKIPVSKTSLSEGIKLAFVGTLTENKSPLKSLEVLKKLNEKGIHTSFTFCGEGPQRATLEKKISEYGLHDKAILLGNVDSERVKEVLKETHFLIFLSRSEGWPKAVSEAMWWGCLPVTMPISCVPWMLGNGERGELVNGNVSEITSLIEEYLSDEEHFKRKSVSAMEWSRQYTIEKFEKEVKALI